MEQKQIHQRTDEDAEKPVDNQKPVDELKSLNEQVQEGTQGIVEGAQQEVAAARVPWYRTTRRGYILLSVYALQLALFAVLAWWVHYHPVLPIDVTITREFQENQAPWLRYTMVAVSYIGNTPWLSVGLVLLATATLALVRLRLEALMLFTNCLTSTLLNGLIKLIVARPRPTASLVEVVQKAGGQSFPSGHVMAYLAFWGFLFSLGIILFKGNRWWRIALLIIPALFVVLVGPSRIYLGDHWASDVLGAYLIGGLLLGLFLWIYLRLKEKGVLARRKREF
ncbi:MAG: phosphatase PAP2 family protein [Ktedonobacteraceae bacterium]